MATATLDAQLKTQLSKSVQNLFNPFRRENFFVGYGKVTGTGQATRTESNDTLTRKNILVAQQVTPSDVAIVIPRVDWTENTTYDEFDPTVDMTTKNFYVYNEENNNVYICVKKGSGASTVLPSVFGSSETETRVYREVTSDGYEWRFVAHVTSAQIASGQLTDDYIPIQTLTIYSDLDPSSYDETLETIAQYGSQYDAVSDPNNGKIQSIAISGTNTAVFSNTVFPGSDHRVQFSVGTTQTKLDEQASVTDDAYNDYAIHFLSGARAGIISRITDYVGSTRTIVHGAISTLAAAGDKYDIRPLVTIAGDGSGATAQVITNADGVAESIAVVSGGTNYKNATATIVTPKASGVYPTLTPAIYKEPGQDPIVELFGSIAKIRVLIQATTGSPAPTSNDYREIFLASGFSVGASYDDTDKAAGHDNFTQTQVDITTVSGNELASNFVTAGDLIYGETSRSFGEVISKTPNGVDGISQIINIRGEYLKDEVLQTITSTGTTLSTRNRDLKVVRTRLGDTTLVTSKNQFRGTHELGITWSVTPTIDTAVTGGSGGVGIVAEIFNVSGTDSTDSNATLRLTQVYGAAGSGTVDFTVGEKLTTTVGEATITTLSGPEINLDSGRMLYIDGIDAVERNDEQQEVIQLLFDF